MGLVKQKNGQMIEEDDFRRPYIRRLEKTFYTVTGVGNSAFPKLETGILVAAAIKARQSTNALYAGVFGSVASLGTTAISAVATGASLGTFAAGTASLLTLGLIFKSNAEEKKLARVLSDLTGESLGQATATKRPVDGAAPKPNDHKQPKATL